MGGAELGELCLGDAGEEGDGEDGGGQKGSVETSLSRTWVGTEVTAASLGVELWGTQGAEDGKGAGQMEEAMGAYSGVSFT